MIRHSLIVALVGALLLPASVTAQERPPDSDTLDRTAPGARSSEDDVGGAEIFLGAFRAIRNYHLDAHEDSALWEKSLQGLVEALDDPYATVFTPDEYSRFQENNTGNYAGIGVQITQLNERITVTAVFRGTPADQVGLQVGDRIVGVDGVDASDWSVDQASDSIRGPAGSAVEVTVAREGLSETIPFTIHRDDVHVPAVTAEVVRDSIGYIRVDRVARNSAAELDSALTELEGTKGIILDLERNPGGYLEEALKMADVFLEPGSVMASAESRVPSNDGTMREEEWTAEEPARIPDVPIVVLVDRYTASASEIVAGALQDHDRALVVGDRTFGKGVVQTVMRIPGDRRIRLTTGTWFTPLGRSLHRPRDARGRALPDQDSLPVVVTEAGRELRGGGGVFPDLQVGDDTLKTAERELLSAAGEAEVPLGVRVAEFAFGQIQRGADPGALDEERFEEFVASLAEDGLPRDVLEEPAARAYLKWEIRSQIALRSEAMRQALEVKMERDRVLAEAVRLLERARSQSELFAAARERADEARAREADSAADGSTSHGPDGSGGGR